MTKKSELVTFESGVNPGRHFACIDNHIIGVLTDGLGMVLIRRLKEGRDDSGSGVYVAPESDLAKPFTTIGAAADACLEYWQRPVEIAPAVEAKKPRKKIAA